MSWSATVKLGEDGGLDEAAINAAASAAKRSQVDDELRATRDAVIDAQADFARRLDTAIGRQTDRQGSLTIHGHIDTGKLDANISFKLEPAAKKGKT